MSGHRIGTDRKETVVVAGCPNGCQGYELEVGGVEDSVDELVEAVAESYGDCSTCGEPIGRLRTDEPSVELE
ncbi:hypothetical protein [Natronosalvus halobius]|uniref:hypothetical protein n=1 Tax=Natronosalvus halobius TaxID=2953746 RepID=UPI00209F51AF|nr:hypothetical protein [Natronosalvus halobius]USZ73782.1 hypothetical protein NGM15_18420 [Natronosalvus halobius]